MPTNRRRSGDPANVMAIDFDDALLAQEAVLATTRLARRGSVKLADAVLVSKLGNGRSRIAQTKEVSPAQAAFSGSWWVGLIALLVAGVEAWIIGAIVGAAAGWAWAKFRDTGIPNPWLDEVADRLSPGHTATVLMLPDFFPAHLLTELRRFRGRLLYSTLDGVEPEAIEDALEGR